MGSIFRFEHKACGFEYKHFDGVGFLGMELEREAYEKIKKGDLEAEVQKLFADNPSGKVTVHNELCYCEKCKAYHSLPQIKFYILNEDASEEDAMFFDPEKYTPVYKETVVCPDCQGETVVMDNVFSVPCPVCGKVVKGKIAGLWD